MTIFLCEVPWRPFLVVIWAATAALWDFRFRRLPNLLTLGGAGVAVVHLLVYGSSILGASPASASAAGVGAFFVLLPFYRLGWLGAGDVKLMLAIGFLGGVDVLLITFVISGVLTLPFALWSDLQRRRRREPSQAAHARLPQGVFLGLGLMFATLAN